MEETVMQDKTIDEMINEIQEQFNIVGRTGELTFHLMSGKNTLI